jgi:hypothetical protein
VSHFATVVLVDEPVTRETAADVVSPLLAPYDENGEWLAEGSRWDWWVIGGRWTGELTGDCDPRDDIANYEVCNLCGGTGERPDGLVRFGRGWVESVNGCNSCFGNGITLSGSFQAYDRDVAPLSSVSADFTPFAVVTPDGNWHEQGRMGWFGCVWKDEQGDGEKPEVLWAAAVKALYEQHPNATAVLVDCHV